MTLLSRRLSALLLLAIPFAGRAAEPKDDAPKITLPPEGELKDGKPAGDGWSPLFAGDDLKGWKFEKEYWTLKDGVLHGEYKGGDKHHYAYTEKDYADFELHALVKLRGEGANSGVCIRIKPTDFDNVPGYQVDMGDGFWGCLWDERGAGMVQKCEPALAKKLVKADDWNHYYVVAKGHRVTAWLNGVKTIDVEHAKGNLDGKIGFQLCHGKKTTIADFKSVFVREMKK